MKTYLCMGVCLLLAGAVSAQAEIIGVWGSRTSGDYTIYTLTVAPTAGETITGFDISVNDATGDLVAGTGRFVTNTTSPTAFSTSLDATTHFLLQTAHGSGKSAVTDLSLATDASDEATGYLAGGFAATAGGSYSGGWTSSMNLLQIAVPTSSGVTIGDLLVQNSDWSKDYAVVSAIVDGVTKDVALTMSSVPEPGTVSLLVAGLLGMLAYAWRKRK
jgi:hypothetical protein